MKLIKRVAYLGLIWVCLGHAADNVFDPTRPPALAVQEKDVDENLKQAKVTMIFYSGEQSICVINGVKYKEGDLFGQFTIKKILNNRVDLGNRGEQVSLYLAQGFS